MHKRIILFLFLTLALTVPALAQDEEIRQWASAAEASSEYGSSSWSASQATGEPDSPDCLDSTAAWASATASEVATLTVYYNIPVIPSEINIYQNYNPGAVKSITLLTPDGDEIELDDAGEAPEDCPGVHVVEVEDVEDAVNGIIITVDQREISNWSEIDAVELVGVPVLEGEVRQWAADAEATSEYGSDSWSAAQATGAPNVNDCVDSTSAWASASASETATLTVSFAIPVFPTEVNIYQTYNPGAIVSVTLIDVDGEAYEFDISEDEATTDCPGVLSIAFEESDVLVNAVEIKLDQSITNNWNEIDAVELVGTTANAGGSAEADLSETLEFEGFSIDYPADWATTIDEGGVPVLASSDDVLENRNDLSDGDIVITVVLPNLLEEQLDIDPTSDIEDVLADVIDAAELDGDIEDYDVLDNPAVIAHFTPEDEDNDAALIVVEYRDGAVMYAVDSGSDFEDYEPLIIEMLNTADYDD